MEKVTVEHMIYCYTMFIKIVITNIDSCYVSFVITHIYYKYNIDHEVFKTKLFKLTLSLRSRSSIWCCLKRFIKRLNGKVSSLDPVTFDSIFNHYTYTKRSDSNKLHNQFKVIIWFLRKNPPLKYFYLSLKYFTNI